MRLIILIAVFCLAASSDPYSVDRFTTERGNTYIVMAHESGYYVENVYTRKTVGIFSKTMSLEEIQRIVKRRH